MSISSDYLGADGAYLAVHVYHRYHAACEELGHVSHWMFRPYREQEAHGALFWPLLRSMAMLMHDAAYLVLGAFVCLLDLLTFSFWNASCAFLSILGRASLMVMDVVTMMISVISLVTRTILSMGMGYDDSELPQPMVDNSIVVSSLDIDEVSSHRGYEFNV